MIDDDDVFVRIRCLRFMSIIDYHYMRNNRIYIFTTLLTIPLLVMMTYAVVNLCNCLVLAERGTRGIIM